MKMNAAGVIVEYNPFHNGHYYHIQETKKVTEADVIVAVMSGNFLQRGEPALVSKWTRTKMALEGGADIVVELPYVFATQKAEIFAYGAVSLLDALKVDSVCFGSENGDIDSFERTLEVMNANKNEFNYYIQQSLKEGKSYPRAAADAFQALQIDDSCIDLSQPNNILGFHYLQAIKNIQSKLEPYTIKRTKAHYHDQSFDDGKIASATSIRKTLFLENSKLSAVRSVIPEPTYRHLVHYKDEYGMFHQWEDYFPFLKYRLLATTPKELKTIYEVEEGIENRILHIISSSQSFNDFMEQLKTKRYTWTRLQRLCLHILTNSNKNSMKKVSSNPTYIRLLGASTVGQKYLNKIKKLVQIPIVSRLSTFSNTQMALDIKASKVFASCLTEPYRSQIIQREYSTPPIRFDQNTRQFL